MERVNELKKKYSHTDSIKDEKFVVLPNVFCY
jgi:hypothetical protein